MAISGALKSALVLVVVAYAMAGCAEANRGWFRGWGSNNHTGWWGWRHPRNNTDQGPKEIVVGGSEGWHFGFNYSDWAFKTAPFYLNDVLVFKYDPPAPIQHSVYLLPSLWSYWRCDLRGARMVANVSEGRGDGFQFTLSRWRPYYFACGERGGIHCNNGTMKFFVMPMLRPWY